MKYRFPHMDATASAFFSRQLEHIRPQLFEVQYPDMKARLFLPMNTEIHPGAEEYTYRVYDKVGQAKMIRDYSTDLPRVDITGSETTQKIRGVADAYGWSIQEARAAMMAQLNLDVRKAMAARYAIEKRVDDALLSGDTELGLVGLFNLSGTVTYTTPNGAAGATEWSTKTPDEIKLDMHGIAKKIYEDSNEIEKPDTLILPTTQYGLVSSTKMGDGDSRTILAAFLADDPHITNVFSSIKLATAGAGSSARMCCYRRDPMKLEGLVPQEFEQFPPQFVNLEVVTPCHARTGGVALYFPKSVAYGDNI